MDNIRFLPPSKKFIKKIKDKKLKSEIQTAIKKIAKTPEIGERKTGDLAGVYGYDVYYNKINYEISYTLENCEDNRIIVIMVGTRENFYDNLKKYLK